MANVNKVILIGNLTRDPELRYTPSGTAVCDFGLAVNRKWKSKDGGDGEDTLFVDCSAWAKGGETIRQYCHKGDPLYVEGRLKLDSWDGKDVQKRSKLSVVVENFQFLAGKRKSEDWVGDAKGVPPSAPPAGDAALDGDIPF